MNYEIETSNYIECAITGTDEPANKVNIFSTFSEAKKQYIESLQSYKDQWQFALTCARELKKKDVDEASCFN